jgi:hypothetical protein
MPLGRLLLPHERLREYHREERRQQRQYSMLYVLRMLLVAYDRRRLLFRALKAATTGAIVIVDRYPSESACAIDSSCFDDAAVANFRPGFKRWMMKREQALYRDMPRPTVVLQLVAQLDLALERDAQRNKPGGPDPEAIRRRWHLENQIELSDSDVPLGIDAMHFILHLELQGGRSPFTAAQRLFRFGRDALLHQGLEPKRIPLLVALNLLRMIILYGEARCAEQEQDGDRRYLRVLEAVVEQF